MINHASLRVEAGTTGPIGSDQAQDVLWMKINQLQPLDSDVQWIALEVRKEIVSKTETTSATEDRIPEKNKSNKALYKNPQIGGFLLLLNNPIISP